MEEQLFVVLFTQFINALKLNLHRPLMGQFPSCRHEQALPFVKVGLDYGGPIFIKGDNPRSKIKFKSYIALFICLVTKAIHLAFVKSLTTQDFLKAFKRFVSRIGLPNLILSDNGTNFVGANKELLRFVQCNGADVERYSAEMNVTWKFIPPSSPHFGGLWEAGIKSAKSLLRRTVGSCILN